MITQKRISFIITFVLMGLVLIAPTLVFGQGRGGTLNSPLAPEYSDWKGVLSGLLKIMVTLAMPVIVLAIVYSGAKLVISANTGKAEGVKDAIKGLKWTFVGSGLILAAWVIANIIGGTVGQILGS